MSENSLRSKQREQLEWCFPEAEKCRTSASINIDVVDILFGASSAFFLFSQRLRPCVFEQLWVFRNIHVVGLR